MSKHTKSVIILLVGIMIFIPASCSSGGAADEEFDAEATLQVLYAEKTSDAQQAAEAAPAEPAADEPAEAAPEDEPVTDQEPLLQPGLLPDPDRTLEDADSSLRATENRVLSGDSFLNNLYERPFTAREMVYQPELDIYTVDFAYDDAFFYFTITLNGMQLESGAMYGVEFDRRLKGRGDLLVLAVDPGDEWSPDSVTVWKDRNGSVGGLKPMVAEEGFTGNGYDEQVELGGERLAFSRLSPEDPHAVQIAVSRALLDNPEEFMWGAWADNGLKDITRFDYNDTMGPGEAGSPFKDQDNYPIKALYSVDNTCRLPFKVEMAELIPGTCKSIPPSSSPENKITCPPGCFLIGDHCECIY